MAVPRSGLRGGGCFQDALVVALVLGDYVVGAEFSFGVDASALAHFAAAVGARENFDGVASGFLYVAGVHQITIHSVLDDFGDAAYIGGDYGDFAGHGFKRGQAERFELRGEQEEIGGGELLVDGVLLTEEEHVFLHLLFADEIFGGAAVGAIANQDELRGHFGAQQRKNLHTIRDALHRAEIREVHEDGLAVGGPLRAQLPGVAARVEIAV